MYLPLKRGVCAAICNTTPVRRVARKMSPCILCNFKDIAKLFSGYLSQPHGKTLELNKISWTDTGLDYGRWADDHRPRQSTSYRPSPSAPKSKKNSSPGIKAPARFEKCRIIWMISMKFICIRYSLSYN